MGELFVLIEGGGLASDETTLGLPLSTNQLTDFEAQLNQLLVFYGIEMVRKIRFTFLYSDHMALILLIFQFYW